MKVGCVCSLTFRGVPGGLEKEPVFPVGITNLEKHRKTGEPHYIPHLIHMYIP